MAMQSKGVARNFDTKRCFETSKRLIESELGNHDSSIYICAVCIVLLHIVYTSHARISDIHHMHACVADAALMD